MRKNITNYRYTKTFSILAAIFISSFLFLTCKISFESDLKGYLKDYTEEVEIIGYSTNIELKSIKNTTDGYTEYYIPSSDNDFIITFSLRNPQRYELSSSYLGFELGQLKANQNSTIDTIMQPNNDPYSIKLTISSSFLKIADKIEDKSKDGDITPIIKITNPKSGKISETYSSLHLVCNTRPKAVTSQVVYEDTGDDSYLLIFNMPDKTDLTGIHKDIDKLVIYSEGNKDVNNNINYSYKLNISDTGAVTLTPESDSMPKIYNEDPTNPESEHYSEFYNPCGSIFTVGEQPVFLKPNKLPQGDVTYYFTLYDKYGLDSKKMNAKAYSVPQLTHPYAVDSNNKLMHENVKISQDENSSMATIRFIPSMFAYYFVNEEYGKIQNTFRYKDGNKTERRNFRFDETLYSTEKNNFDLLTNSELQNLKSKKWLNGQGEEEENTYEDTINNWTLHADENTSDSTLHYAIYKIHDDGTEDSFTSNSCEFTKSASMTGERPTRKNVTYNTDGSLKECEIDFKDTDLLKDNHNKPIEIPCGNVKIVIYSSHDGYIDSATYEFTMEVLRTRVYTGSGDDNYPGTLGEPFKTVNYALQKLSVPEDSKNTVYLTNDITENITIPESFYVKIASNDKDSKIWSISAKNKEDAVLTIPENATVILENLKVSGNIIVGKGAKLYLNNVEMEEGIIEANEDSHVILGGTTTIKADLDTKENPTEECAYILLKDDSPLATVQIGDKNVESPSMEYNLEKAQLVLIKTENSDPDLKTVILESENKNSTLPEDIRKDLAAENTNPFQLFRFITLGYYVEDFEGKGVIGIPAATVKEPEIGGFTISLDKLPNDKGVWTYTMGTSITVTIKKGNVDYTNNITDKKLQLSYEGDLIRTVNTFTISTYSASATYRAGKYALTVSFTYDGIQYSEELLLNLEE